MQITTSHPLFRVSTENPITQYQRLSVTIAKEQEPQADVTSLIRNEDLALKQWIIETIGVEHFTPCFPHSLDKLKDALIEDEELNNIPLCDWLDQFKPVEHMLETFGITGLSGQDVVQLLKMAVITDLLTHHAAYEPHRQWFRLKKRFEDKQATQNIYLDAKALQLMEFIEYALSDDFSTYDPQRTVRQMHKFKAQLNKPNTLDRNRHIRKAIDLFEIDQYQKCQY